MDFWYYFLHKAIDLVKDDGCISYITSRYWISSAGAKKLIKRVKDELAFVSVVDIGKLKVFDEVVGHHMVVVYKKSKQKTHFNYIKLKKDLNEIKTNNENIDISYDDIFTNNGDIVFEKSNFNTEDTVLLGEITESSIGVQESPDKLSVKQIETHKAINGYAPGEGVFVLSKEEVNTLDLNASEKTILKKYLNPNDLFKYGVKWSDEYLIYSDKGIKELIKKNGDFINLKKHLDKYRNFITSSNKPYGIHRGRDLKYFINPKIIFKGMFVENEFAYDEEGYFVGFSFSLIIQKNNQYSLKYILAILNSRFGLDWFNKNGKKRGVGVDIGVEKLRLFPIKIVDELKQKCFIEIVDKIIVFTKDEDYLRNSIKQAQVKEYEKQIDQLVYKLYGLTPEEIVIMEEKNEI